MMKKTSKSTKTKLKTKKSKNVDKKISRIDEKDDSINKQIIKKSKNNNFFAKLDNFLKF